MTTSPRVQHGGVVFRIGGQLHFLPATVAMKLLPVPTIAEVPGSPGDLRGIALVDGEMIPIVDLLGAPQGSGAMLVCAVLGERVGLVGLEVVETGRFDAAEQLGEVVHRNETARSFDVTALIAKVRESSAEASQEAARVGSAAVDAERALGELNARLRSATGSDPETARAIADAMDHARALVSALAVATAKAPRALVLAALRPVLEPLFRLVEGEDAAER